MNSGAVGPPRRRGVTIAAGALVCALAVGLADALPAEAVPIRGMRITTDSTGIDYSAVILSPPTARHCYANVQALLVVPSPFRVVRSHGNTRVNVCRTESGGWTAGFVSRRFWMVNVRAGDYALCLRAVQILQNGRNSAHVECRRVRWRG
jgi:hypothetical protein